MYDLKDDWLSRTEAKTQILKGVAKICLVFVVLIILGVVLWSRLIQRTLVK